MHSSGSVTGYSSGVNHGAWPNLSHKITLEQEEVKRGQPPEPQNHLDREWEGIVLEESWGMDAWQAETGEALRGVLLLKWDCMILS